MSTIQWASDLEIIKVWKVHLCTDAGKLIDCQIRLPKNSTPLGCSFLNESEIVFNDNFGNVYKVNFTDLEPSLTKIVDYSKTKLITFTLAVDDQLLMASEKELVFYQKMENIDQSIIKDLQHPIEKLEFSFDRTSVGLSKSGELFKIFSSDDIHFETILFKDRNYDFMAVVSDTFFTMVDKEFVTIYELETGTKIKSFEHKVTELSAFFFMEKASQMVLGSRLGKLKFIKYCQPECLVHHSDLFICNNEIEIIKDAFPFVVVSDTMGIFFIIDTIHFNVVSFFETKNNILDYIPTKIHEDLKIVICYKMAETNFGSREVEIAVYTNGNSKIQRHSLCLDKPIASISKFNNTEQYITNPYLTKELQILAIENSPPFCISIKRDISTNSQFKYLKVKSCSKRVLTFGFDGQVTIFDDSFGIENTFKSIHRTSKGIKDLHFNNKLSIILVQDRSGNVYSFKLNSIELGSENIINPPEMKEWDIPNVIEEGETEPSSWLESLLKETTEKDKLKSENDREFIFSKIDQLRGHVSKLLDKNEVLPEDEKLPVQVFNLNEEENELIELKTKSANEALKIEMENFIETQNQITQWLLSNCWNVMEEKSKCIRGIFLDIKVENYSLVHDDEKRQKDLEIAIEKFQIDHLAKSDVFLPWRPIGTTDLEQVLSQDPIILKVKDLEFGSPQSSFQTGTMTHKFITSDFPRYDQLDVVSYQQMHVEDVFGFFTMLNLRKYFNTHFSELESFKLQQMNIINEKNNRLRVIQKELNILAKLCDSKEVFADEIIDPEYSIDEVPEKIKIVSDEDIAVIPYFSPRKDNADSDEELKPESSRQDLFADNFRERMLHIMMDNVLEIRWEDEIKKTPSIPVALKARKELKDYDEHDFRAVKEYEDKLKFLGAEREKYKQMLLTEKHQIQDGLDKQILDFNYRLGHLINLKINVQMAINQENVKLLRNKFYNFRRLHFLRQEQEIRLEISAIKKDISGLTQVAHELEKKMIECKGALENLDARDKSMDKQFKNNFAEASSHAIVDQAYKFFK